MKTTNWKNAYPINTFTGKTQMELIGFIESLLQANDDKWKERIKELIEKNKAYDFGIYDYEGIALDLINLLKEKTNEK